MIDTAASIYLFVVAFRLSMAVKDQAAILREFGQTPAKLYVVWLVPCSVFLASIAHRIFSEFSPVIGAASAVAVGAVLCIPTVLVTHTTARDLERAGTDRVNRALEAVRSANVASYIAIVVILAIQVLMTAALTRSDY